MSTSAVFYSLDILIIISASNIQICWINTQDQGRSHDHDHDQGRSHEC